MAGPRTIVVAAAAALLVVAVPAAAQETADVEVVDIGYEPTEITVDAGGSVTWTQTGSLPHTVTADDGSFDSHPDCSGGENCMAAGDTFAQTFDTPGTYPYYCRIHGGPGGVGMSGVVVVTAAGETATPTETAAPTEQETAQVTGAISVSDQTGDGTTVAVDAVTITGAEGFVVVHLDEDGAPGQVLGHVGIPEGTSSNVQVPLDSPLAEAATVWPMLHVDAGTLGTYEFPGADTPVSVDGEVVMAPLALTVTTADQAPTEPELPATGTAARLWVVLTALAVVVGAALVLGTRLPAGRRR